MNLNLEYEDLVLSFLDLGSDLRNKLSRCYGDSTILYNLAFISMSMLDTVDALTESENFNKEIPLPTK